MSFVGEQGVRWSKAFEFLDLLEMEEKTVVIDKGAHEAFETFLEGQASAWKHWNMKTQRK